MKCTPVAAAALITLFVALVLNIIAFALPFWSRSYDVVSGWLEDRTRATGDFATGPWGFCTDVSLGSSSDAANHCYLFRTSSSYDFAMFGNDFRANFSEHSVCEGYRTARSGNESVELEYVSALADVAGLNATSFGKFLHSSCGGTGQSTLAFAILSILATLIGFLLLVVGMTCRKTDSRVIFLGRLMIALAAISALLTFILWLVQSKSLNDEDRVKYGASFQLSVVGAAFNLAAMGFVAAYRDDVDALDLVWMGPLYICANW